MSVLSRLRPIAARPPLSKTVSYLAPGRVLEGHRWDYRIISTLKGDDTHLSTVFKAEVIPHMNVQNAPRWSVVYANDLTYLRLTLPYRAIVKAALPEKLTTIENLQR